MKKTAPLSITALAALLAALGTTLVAGNRLWSLAGVQAMQALGGWLTLPMRIFTFLGDEQFYLLAIPLVYWCIHKGLGADLGMLLVLSSFANSSLKSLFKQGRPFWEDAALKLSSASSFSTPSGHAQGSAALFGQVAWLQTGRRRAALWIAGMALLAGLVALSRVYLGVHFPGDILWGAAIGLGVLALYEGLKPAWLPWLTRLSLGMHMLLAMIAAVFILGIESLLLAIPFGAGQMYGDLYVEARGTTLAEAATIAGLALGLWIGLVLETRHIRFSVAGPWWQRTLRYVIGVIGLAAVWMGFRLLLPQEPLALGLALRVVRYGLAMLWVIVIWPWLFVRIKLGQRGE